MYAMTGLRLLAQLVVGGPCLILKLAQRVVPSPADCLAERPKPAHEEHRRHQPEKMLQLEEKSPNTNIKPGFRIKGLGFRVGFN